MPRNSFETPSYHVSERPVTDDSPYGREASPVSDLAGRFWARVDKSGGCWEWTGPRTEVGYGRIKVKGKWKSAHRLAYTLM